MTQNARKCDESIGLEGPPLDQDDGLEEAWNYFIKAAQTHDESLRARVAALETVTHQASSPTYIASLLPSLLRLAPPREVLRALRPLVEDAIAESVKKHSHTMADIIFPLILPAVRRAVLEIVRQMLRTFDRALEEAFSFQGLKWRWQAIRTGQSFAEVVLMHSLIYRVEEVFFIHRKTGLLLAHAARERRKNPDEIAAMFSAIRDFVSDVYAQGQDSLSLKTLEIGDVQIWVEDLPHAALAVALRGEAPPEYRDSLLTTCLSLRRDFEIELLRFEGDVTPFSRVHETLEEIIIECLREKPPDLPVEKAWKQALRWLARLALVIVIVSVLILALVPLRQAHLRERELQQFLNTLSGQAGVMVIAETSQGEDRYEVKALRDRFADTEHIKAPGFVSLVWGQFESLDPLIVGRRIKHVLEPPPSVQLSFGNGTLSLEGSAPHNWIAKLKNLAPAITGLERTDDSRLIDLDQEGFEKAERLLEAMNLDPRGGLPPSAAPSDWTRAFSEQSLLLDQHARALGTTFYIVLEASVRPIWLNRAHRQLHGLGSQLSWELQTRGITTYRIIRTEVSGSENGNGSVKIKVARHGVRYDED